MATFFGIRPETLGRDRPTRRTRTWNDGGIQYTHQESSYNGPNSAFFTFSRTAELPLDDRDPPRASRGRSASLLGTVVNGLADYVTANSQRAVADRGHVRGRTPRDEDLAYDDKDHEDWRSSGRPKSRFSRVAASLAEPQASKKQRSRRHHHQHAQTRPQFYSHRPASNAQSAFVEEYTSGDESDTSDSFDGDSPADYNATIEALENAAEYYRREAKLARRQLEQGCRQGTGNSRQLQNLARKVEEYDNARDSTLRDLKEARADAEGMSQGRRRSRRPRSIQHQRIMDDFDDDPIFNDPFLSDFFGAPRQQRSANPMFAASSGMNSVPHFNASPFAAFDSLFANLEQMHSMHGNIHQHSFNIPGPSVTASFGARPQASRASTTSGNRSRHQQPFNFAIFTPQPTTPPATLLKPEEARRLYATYNERWHTVSTVDPNIPFPARGLTPANLSLRNTLWAPSVNSPVDTWSEETVMKANTQAFFLGAVGMTPTYSEAAGAKIELGIDKASASPAQAHQLITLLKKERVRWHSDRLGKRNAGRTGPNEILQNDRRARAVYHGVCELIEAAQ